MTSRRLARHPWSPRLLVSLFMLFGRSLAGPGDVDPTFDPGKAVNGPIHAFVVQPDGRIVIGGAFTRVRGLARTNLARLHPDGTGDPTFQSDLVHGPVDTLARLDDGRILVGSQHAYEVCIEDWGCVSETVSRLTRHLPDGAQDGSFTPATVNIGSPWGLSALTVQPDLRILVGGQFSQINGTNWSGIARLNADGTLDSTFNPGSGIGGHQAWVYSIVVQPDQRILVGGMFAFFDGTPRKGLARLAPNGMLEPAFDPMAAFGGEYPSIQALGLQPDGKVLAAGRFTNAAAHSLIRIQPDGALDTRFTPEIPGSAPGAPLPVLGSVAIGLQADGRILVGSVHALTTECNEDVCYPTTLTNSLVRLLPDGRWDASFKPPSLGAAGWRPMHMIQPRPDGGLLVAGEFIRVNGVDQLHAVRLGKDGSVDPTFSTGYMLFRAPRSVALQADGKLLLGELFTESLSLPTASGPQGALAFQVGNRSFGSSRLASDGSPDRSFEPARFPGSLRFMFHDDGCPDSPMLLCEPSAFAGASLALRDGRVLVAGQGILTVSGEETFFGVAKPVVGRFGSDGLLLEPLSHLAEFVVMAMLQQPDGRILLGGYSKFRGAPASVLRLHEDGSVDEEFKRGRGPAMVTTVTLDSQGRILAGGPDGIARLLPDGTRDDPYKPVVTGVNRIVIQPDDRLLVGGSFAAVNGIPRANVARLHRDGSTDEEFHPGTGVAGPVYDMVLQPDGQVVIVGEFHSVNGVARSYAARLIGRHPAPRLRASHLPDGHWSISWPIEPAGDPLVLQQASRLDLPDWSRVDVQPVTVGMDRQVTLPAAPGNRFFRLVTAARP